MKKQLTSAMLGVVIALPVAAAAQDAVPVDTTAAPLPPTEGAASETLRTIPVAGPAPEKAAPEAAARPASRLIEEVVVTAQKREERIQDVPIAITAFSAEKLEALGVQTAQDLEHITPGLTITNAAGFNVAYLRGIGTDAFLPGADSSVPFYLDGVPLLGAQGSSDTLGRVERIEVLKGPQGTLFGRNSTGGAISIVTPEPGDSFSGDANVDYGNYDARKALIYVTGPITDSVAASLAVFDGGQTNFVVNDKGPVIDVYSRGGRAKLRWTALDNLKITLAGSYQEASNNAGLAFENTRVAPDFALLLPQDPKADRHVSLDSLAGARIRSHLFSGTIDWSTAYVDVKFIGSEQRLDAPFVQADFDKSALPIINIHSIHQTSGQRTAELQFLSNNETPLHEYFKWVGGFFYLQSSGGFNPIAFQAAPNALTAISNLGAGSAAATAQATVLTTALNSVLTPLGVNLVDGGTVLSNGVLVSKSTSAYFQGTTSLSDHFDLTTGLRFQHEERDLVDSATGIQKPDGSEQSLISENVPTLYSNQLSPRVALQWRPADDNTQIYTSWARGFKSPTYNTVNVAGGVPTTVGGIRSGQLQAPQIEPLKSERVDSFELGVKTELFDRNLRLNSAVFYTLQHDLLTGFVAVASGGVVSYENAPAAKIKGFESDFLLTPLPDLDAGLVLTGAISLIDGKYTKYPNGKGFDTTSGLAFGSGGTEVLPARDFSGNRIVRTPKATLNFGVSQTIPVTSGSVEIAGDANFSSGFFFLPQNASEYSRQPGTILNARATYIFDPWHLQLTAFVSNLTQKDYNEVVFVDDFGRNQVLNAPRTYGLRVKWSF